jgi:hypothetical protein
VVDNVVHKLNGSESSYDACPPSPSPKSSNLEEPVNHITAATSASAESRSSSSEDSSLV